MCSAREIYRELVSDNLSRRISCRFAGDFIVLKDFLVQDNHAHGPTLQVGDEEVHQVIY